MSKDISLILASQESLVAIVRAGKQGSGVVLQAIDDPIKNDSDFADYLDELCQEYDFTQTEDFYSTAGYYATWVLASYMPAWYLRNVSPSLFLEGSGMDRGRYISALDFNSLATNTPAYDRFPDADYCLGGVITPQNARNFIEDYRNNPGFKARVDSYFGIFIWGLFDALVTAVHQNTSLIESMDIFGVNVPSDSGALGFVDMAAYSADTYEMTGIALQGYSAKAQLYVVQAKRYEGNGDADRANLCRQARKTLIDMMVRNASVYAARVRQASGVELPEPAEHYWD